MLAGDWHGNGQWAQGAIHHARKMGADVIVHAGDFGFWTSCLDTEKYLRFVQRNLVECGITLYWVDGNHEDHERIQEWLDAVENQPWCDKRYPNIIHLPRGFRWQWWGKDWLAMGGAHSVDRHLRTEGESWWPGEHITEEQVENAIAGGKADIMITHDCPDGSEIPGIHADEKIDAEKGFWPLDQIKAANAHRKKLARVVNAVQPALLLHGHYHVRYNRYRAASSTMVIGLAEDGSSLDANTLFLHRREEQCPADQNSPELVKEVADADSTSGSPAP